MDSVRLSITLSSKSAFETSALNWHELSYSVADKAILKKQSGKVQSGDLVALIGPSGAGKSTLLSTCLAGRSGPNDTGMNGSISFSKPHLKKNLKLAFVPQFDVLYGQFSARETLEFASKIKNSPKTNHRMKVDDVLGELDLLQCQHVKVSRLSGGQRKRLAIGVELISDPDFMLLDEPTTGLDSSAAQTVINLLRRLTAHSGQAIIASIHQPNNELFCSFTSIYLMSHNGQNIYQGPPQKFLEYCRRFGLECPKTRSLSEFAIDVARGKYGEHVIEQMATHLLANQQQHITESSDILSFEQVQSKGGNPNVSWPRQVALICKRSLQFGCTRTPLLLGKVIFGIFLALLTAFMFDKDPIGRETGCADFNVTTGLEALDQVQLRDRFVAKINRMLSGVALYILGSALHACLVTQIVAALIFPMEFRVLKNELANNWYSRLACFVGRTIADFIAILFTLCIPYWTSFYLTEQPDLWRAWPFLITYLLTGLIGEALGTISTLMLPDNNDYNLLIAAQINAALIGPAFFFCGFFTRYSELSSIFKPLAWLSYARYSFENLLLAVYGFGKCPKVDVNVPDLFSMVAELNSPVGPLSKFVASFQNNTQIKRIIDVDPEQLDSVLDKSVDFFNQIVKQSDQGSNELESSSLILKQFELNDSQFYKNLIILIMFYLIVKWLSYLIYCRRSR